VKGFSDLPRRFNNLRLEYQARLRNLAVQNRLLSADRSYTKFIILTRSRSGSNFLVDLLNSHGDIVCFNELFSRSGQTLWGLPGYGHRVAKSSSVARLKNADPVRFIEHHVYRSHPRHVTAVGFKLLYNQAHKGTGEQLWQYLRELEDVKVIHLKRKNLLNVLVSKKKADADGVWVSRDNTAVHTSQSPLEVSHEECMALFNWTREQQNKYDAYFERQEKLDLVYEDLLSDTETVMNAVQDFLGVDKRKLTAQIRKQSNRPLSEVIANYTQLKTSFAGTEWESLFD